METKNRNVLFDNFRGMLMFIFVMLAVMAAIYRYNADSVIPDWVFDHAQGRAVGPFGSPFTPVDLGMIFFYFIGGMTAVPAYRSRAFKDGKKAAMSHLFTRNLSLIGIGTVMYLVAALFTANPNPGLWGPLQAIGFTGILTMAFLHLDKRRRAIAGIAFIAVHEIFSKYLYTLWNPQIFTLADGGFQVCLMYAGFFLITTVLFELYAKNFSSFLLGLLPIIAFTVAIYFVLPPTYRPYNVTFFAVTYSVVALIFIIFRLILDFVKFITEKIFRKHTSGLIPLAGLMGRNMLLYFIIRYPLSILFQILYNSLFVKAGVYLGGAIVAILAVGLLVLIEYTLKKKNILIKM
ncbi:MAG: hypothetical protein LBT30_08190 [Clostridiales bacterium]|jgi:hypothetical protein|nr:hypothetical protein [Clostridiales bacterium]